jgi:hypothetical protein
MCSALLCVVAAFVFCFSELAVASDKHGIAHTHTVDELTLIPPPPSPPDTHTHTHTHTHTTFFHHAPCAERLQVLDRGQMTPTAAWFSVNEHLAPWLDEGTNDEMIIRAVQIQMRAFWA